MSDLIAEPTGEATPGTEAGAHSLTKPAVEVTFAVNRQGEHRPLDVESARAARIQTGIARMQALGAAQGKAVAAAVPAVVPAKAEPARVDAPPATKSPEQAAVDEALAANPAEAPDEVDPDAAAAAGAAAPEAEVAADPAKEDETPEAKADPLEVAAVRAELETSNAELAHARAQLEQHQLGAVSEDERTAYIDRPVDGIRGLVARLLGVAPDSKEVAEELAHLQRELTIEAIGLDSLPDDRKHQRTSERFERAERLKPLARTASSKTAEASQKRQATVSQVASAIEATSEEFPHLATAAAVNGSKVVADAALAFWVQEVKAGRIKVEEDDAKNMRSALELTNRFYSTKLAKRQATNTAPPPATAPAQASTKEAATGAPAPTKSTAPAKTGSATPKTLSAKQAAAAPVARAAPEPKKDGPLTIDPHDREARNRRRLEIGQRLLANK